MRCPRRTPGRRRRRSHPLLPPTAAARCCRPLLPPAAAARSLPQALGFRLGVFHVECKYTSRGARLIEVNARMGGGPVR
jgi:hypothetical protein